MYCSVCKKVIATVHVTRIQNNQIIEAHYCTNCASQKNANHVMQSGNITDIIQGLLHAQTEGDENLLRELGSSVKNCTRCGLTYERFKEIGKLGCAECYKVFKDEMDPLLRRIHGSAHHQGKSPQRTIDLVRTDKKIFELRQQLVHAVKSENYEEAARIRDQIDEAEKNFGN